MMLGQFSRALDDARLSVQLDPEFVKGHVRIAKCCLSLGELIGARQAIDRALAIECQNSAVQAEASSLEALERLQGDAKRAYDAKEYRKVRVAAILYMYSEMVTYGYKFTYPGSVC